MIVPRFLNSGNKIAIVAPGGKIDVQKIEYAVKVLKNWHYDVVLGKHLFENEHQFSASDNKRAEDFQNMLDDSNISAILCARGGYGSVRILEKLNFSKFIINPKWIIGYSDITVFHAIMNKMNICSMHAIMPVNFSENPVDESMLSLKRLLTGEIVEYQFPSCEFNRTGIAFGELVGGNLSIIYSLRGTFADIDTDNKILFIEDVGEYLYHIDRMMMNLKLGGKLKNLKALIVGSFTDLKDNETPFGKSVKEIIKNAVAEYDYPVCFDFYAGHGEQNNALIFGRLTNLKVEENKIIVS